MKPLRRSATFWCGLFVLVFLLWAWVDSHWHMTGVRIEQAGRDEETMVWLLDGKIVWWSLEEAVKQTPLAAPEWDFLRVGAGKAFPVEDAYAWRREHDLELSLDAAGVWQVSLRQYTTVQPYAIVPGGFALLWLAFLGWRSRQRKLAAVASSAHADLVQCGNP